MCKFTKLFNNMRMKYAFIHQEKDHKFSPKKCCTQYTINN